MSLIQELQRRSVFKVGAAYLVVGWLVVQVASIAFPAFEAPPWALRVFMLVVALGFPLALVLAWVFDITPEGVRLDAQGVGTKRIFTVAAVLAALVVGWFLRGGISGAPGVGEPGFVAPLGEKSTAVLPFVNMSSDAENEHFSDGLTETLLHKLAQVTELKVAARTSSFAFKGKQEDIRAIGRELGVATVVEGSVQRAGDTLRITAQLVRTSDGSHIWSRNYDRKVQDIFAIQDEIAGAVTEALVGALAPEAKAAIAMGGTQDLVAYELYTKALQRAATNAFDDLAEAERLLNEALARDPRYLDALLTLAQTWSEMAGTGMFSTAELDRRLAPLLDRIEAIAPDDGMYLALRGDQARRAGDGGKAREFFERAIAAAPGNALVHNRNGLDLGRSGADPVGGLAAIDRAIALDPLNPDFHMNRAFNLRGQRRFDEAEAAAQRVIELDPRVPTSYTVLGDLALQRGDLVGMAVEYRRAARADPHDHEIAGDIGGMLVDLGRFAEAEAWIAESRRLSPNNLFAAQAEAQLLYARDDLPGAVAVAMAIVGRHQEERRANWINAMAIGCLAAKATGRAPELRSALEGARVLARTFTLEEMKAIATPLLTVDHQFGHVARLAPCFLAPGPSSAAPRAQMQATLTAVRGPEWAAAPGFAFLDGVVRDDRAALVAQIRKGDALPSASDRALRELHRSRDQLVHLGVADDPWVGARLEEAARAAIAQGAQVDARFAQAGLSVLPAPAAAR
jgi:TolB-like protein/Tfp pilus assembly protein PilF